MPKLTYSSAKGLVQEKGSGDFNLSGEGVLFGQKDKVAAQDTAVTLTAASSGRTYTVSAATAYDITLPSAASGLWLKFVVGTAGANDVDLVQAAATEDFVGTVVNGSGGGDTFTGTDTKIIFASSTAVAGDWVELTSNGTVWFVRGNCDATGGIVGG